MKQKVGCIDTNRANDIINWSRARRQELRYSAQNRINEKSHDNIRLRFIKMTMIDTHLSFIDGGNETCRATNVLRPLKYTDILSNNIHCAMCESFLPSVLWRCWLGGRKGIRLVKNWVVRCWHGYLSGARCRLAYAKLMPLPLTVSCFSKIQTGFTFLVPAHPGSPGKKAVKRVCVCESFYTSN